MTIFSTSTAAFFDRAKADMSGLRAQADALQQQIGTGQRLTVSSDDPVAASRLRALARTDTLSSIDTANANRAGSDLQLADSALSSFSAYITQAQDLAMQAGSDVLSASQRASIATQLDQINQNLVTLANSRDSAGHALFGGQTAGDAYTVDASGNAVYIGTAGSGDLSLGEGQSVTRGVTGPEFLNFTVNGTATDLMATIKALSDALKGGVADPAAAARDASSTLSSALDAVTTSQTVVGSRLAWIDMATQHQTTMSELRASEKSDIGDTDVASTVAQLQQVMTVLQASQASFVKLSGLSLFSMLN